MPKTITKYAEQLNDDQQKILNLHMTGNTKRNTQKILNLLEIHCGRRADLDKVMSGNKIEIWNKHQCEALKYMNEADTTSACIMKQLNDAISKLEKHKMKMQSGVTFDHDNHKFQGITWMLLLIFMFIAAVLVYLMVWFYPFNSMN